MAEKKCTITAAFPPVPPSLHDTTCMYYMAPYCSLLLIADVALQHPAVTAAKLPTAAWWRLRLYVAASSHSTKL
jgi:hypothetical protein